MARGRIYICVCVRCALIKLFPTLQVWAYTTSFSLTWCTTVLPPTPPYPSFTFEDLSLASLPFPPFLPPSTLSIKPIAPFSILLFSEIFVGSIGTLGDGHDSFCIRWLMSLAICCSCTSFISISSLMLISLLPMTLHKRRLHNLRESRRALRFRFVQLHLSSVSQTLSL